MASKSICLKTITLESTQNQPNWIAAKFLTTWNPQIYIYLLNLQFYGTMHIYGECYIDSKTTFTTLLLCSKGAESINNRDQLGFMPAIGNFIIHWLTLNPPNRLFCQFNKKLRHLICTQELINITFGGHICFFFIVGNKLPMVIL